MQLAKKMTKRVLKIPPTMSISRMLIRMIDTLTSTLLFPLTAGGTKNLLYPWGIDRILKCKTKS